MFSHANYLESAAFIRGKLGDFKPEVLLVLGSGLGYMGDFVDNPIRIPYVGIPHFKAATAPGHEGQFVAGQLRGKNVLMMQGRFHVYEGYTAAAAAYPVRVAKCLGVNTMIVTNACGGVNTSYKVGELVLLNDFIKFADINPLIGPNMAEFGPRFKPMNDTFDKAYIALAKEVGKTQGFDLKEGIYFYMTGPQYETPAEIRAIRVLGGDVVGMSTVPECLAAAHAGMKTLGVSLVTNMAAGVLESLPNEGEVIEEAEKAKAYFSEFICGFLEKVTL